MPVRAAAEAARGELARRGRPPEPGGGPDAEPETAGQAPEVEPQIPVHERAIYWQAVAERERTAVRQYGRDWHEHDYGREREAEAEASW